MFGYALTHDQKRRILELIGWVATSDREISDDERAYVVDLAHEFDTSAEGVFRIGEERSVESICEDFDDDTASRIALIHLIRLSFVDAMYREEEWLGVREIGDHLGIPDQEVDDFDDWVQRGLEWEEKGRDLLGLPSEWAV